MNKTIYDEMTKTYRVSNENKTFDSYTPAQYIEKFGALPEPVEDVTDVVVEPVVETIDDPVESVQQTGEVSKSAEVETITEPEAVTEAQDQADDMVDFIVTEESLEVLNANHPEGVELNVVGDTVKLAKNHPLLEVPEKIEEPVTPGGGVLGAIKNAITPNQE